MNGLWYKVSAWFLILFGAVWLLGNIYANIISELLTNNPSFYEIFLGGILGSIGISIWYFVPGIYLFNLKKHNKLTNWGVIFIFMGIILFMLSLLLFVIGCLTTACDPFGLVIPFFGGIVPLWILYGFSIILLIINKIKS